MDVTREVYRLVGALPREETYGFRSQMTRAAVSIPCNIAEGWTRESHREKAYFLAIAHGSHSELETLLTLCEDLGWLAGHETIAIRESLDQLSRMLTALRRRQRRK